MSAKPGAVERGRGEASAFPDGVGGNVPPTQAEGLTEEQIAELQGLDAKEAIESLGGISGADKLPELGATTFPGPIAEAFYWSNADVLGIVGPVGCLAAETEVLTPKGWVRIDEWRDQPVMVWQDGRAWFEKPQAFVDLPCDEMWRFASRKSLSMVLSDEHRVPLFDYRGTFCVRLAADLAATPSRYRVPVTFRREGRSAIPDARLRLHVAIAADGCLPARGQQVIVTVRKERKKVRLRELLRAAGIKWRERSNATRQTETGFVFSRQPWMSKALSYWRLPTSKLQVILDEITHWDGLFVGPETRFSTTDRASADFIQFAAHATGGRAHIGTYNDPRSADWKPVYTVQIARAGSRKATVGLRGDHTSIERVPAPGGRKYCFTTSTGFFLARHDGKIFVTGNSGKTTTLMKSRLRRAIEMPRSTLDGVRRYKVLFIRETYRQLWSTSIPSYLETFPKHFGTWSGGRGDPVTHVIPFEDEHGPIEFTAEFMAFGDNIVASMRGVQTTDIVLNEMDTMPVEILTVGIGRIDRWPARTHFAGLPPQLQSYGQIVGDFNAPDEDNFTHKVFYDEEERTRMASELSAALPAGAKRIEIAFFRQPGYGEPGCENLQNLSPTYYPRQIASMKLAGRGDMIDRMVFNKVVYLRVGEPVWKREFNDRIHVADGPIPFIPSLPLMIGLDQGFKGAAVIAQVNGFWRWRILGELHFPQERLMAQVFGLRLREVIDERWPEARIEAAYGDMAGEHGASQAADENMTWNLMVGRAAGFLVRPQVIGTNRIQPRLEAVRAALEAPLEAGEPGLLIDPSCRFLRRGFAARYVWADEPPAKDGKRKTADASGDKRKVPDKSFTEANVHDALQYLLLSGHRADGTSPYAGRLPGRGTGLTGPDGRPPRPGEQPGGLKTGWDVLSPYGE